MRSQNIIDPKRARLPGRTERVGKTTDAGGWGGFLFGAAFVVAGVFILLVGLGVVPVDPATIHGPIWVVLTLGGIFAVSGLLVWVKALQGLIIAKSCRAPVGDHPQSAILADYPWNVAGIKKSPWGRVWKSLGPTIFLAVFLAPFNWWAWYSGAESLLLKIIVTLFDLGLILATVELGRRFLAALKYGSSALEYARFPCFTGDRVDLRWLPPSGLENAARLTFVLRCVEEWLEYESTGEGRRVTIIHEQLWAATRMIEGPADSRVNQPISLSFELPATVPGSKLSGMLPAIFWELEVSAEATGVDFQERYLVPIYSSEFQGGQVA